MNESMKHNPQFFSGPGAIIFQSVAGPTFAFSHGPLCVLLTAGKET